MYKLKYAALDTHNRFLFYLEKLIKTCGFNAQSICTIRDCTVLQIEDTNGKYHYLNIEDETPIEVVRDVVSYYRLRDDEKK